MTMYATNTQLWVYYHTDLKFVIFYSMSEEERVRCGSALRKENLCPVLAELTALYKTHNYILLWS